MMSSLWAMRNAPDGAEGSKGPEDVADTGVADVGPPASDSGPSASPANPPPQRPGLQRNQMQPPAGQPPPAPNNVQSTDGLSLAQVRRVMSEFGDETLVYDFVYSDFDTLPEEVDEWFNYQFWQWVRLNAAQRAFEWQWENDIEPKYGDITWEEASEPIKSDFVRQALESINASEMSTRNSALGRIMYIVLGRWGDTAGAELNLDKEKARTLASSNQIAAMAAGVELVAEVGAIPEVYLAFQRALEKAWTDDSPPMTATSVQEAQDELMNLMTIMYIIIQETLHDPEGLSAVRQELLDLNPPINSFMLATAAKLRWDESNTVPETQTLLLLWKSLLLVFGGTKEIQETRKALSETSAGAKSNDLITASPLDYHVFRQEITSKYPAYIPPQPALPFEADNTSILPPLPNHPTRNNGSNGIIPAPPNSQNGGGSILHQPVHIATPAPSPPPSPGVGGKGGKKQNYQTNQNFPFIYPPLDATSNSAGGKGGAGLQEQLVGRKWEGSDIPASILEAGELFSTRVRMTRATRQLWDERERFLKYERGWNPDEDDVEDLDLDSLSLDEDKLLATIERRLNKTHSPNVDYGPNPDLDPEVKRRLEALESFYTAALPQMQSLTIVLMKGVLNSVTASLGMPPNGLQHQGGPNNNGRINGQGLGKGGENLQGPNGFTNAATADMSLEDVDAIRTREITAKAVTGIILLILKWLKISNVLQFEYFAQLLLDSNYLPLALKLFAHQDVQQMVDSKPDRLEHSFFQFCNQRAAPSFKPIEPTEIDGVDDDSDEDAAMPPPIKRRRSPPRPETSNAAQSLDDAAKGDMDAPARPEVDELGLAPHGLPKEPITDFSRRNFFTLINFLRILQKICKNKAHRNLLLVQYKSSNIIRKALRIPQQELRLYTLKLFKNQVPYCGRKWRQSNMRVITAVYLHCRPELRDEWLAGSDVDAEVEEALPLEQALRSLTHWFNVRRYPDQMATELQEALRDEQDFFKRELDRLEVFPEAGSAENINAGEWEAAWG